MDQDRRSFLAEAGKYILLTGAAALAWDNVLAGTPEKAPNYTATDHWWGMVIDIDRCIGCGNCVRACKAENNVPLEEGAFRTWVERYEVDPADMEHPRVQSPNGGYDGFAGIDAPGEGVKVFFVPKLCNHCADSPCVQACPYGCRYIDPRTHTVDKCTLCYHRITKGLTTACCESCPTAARQLVDLKNPSDPVHAFLRTHKIHVLKPQMATGAKVYYAGLDGSVR